jgi:hypothetical protein
VRPGHGDRAHPLRPPARGGLPRLRHVMTPNGRCQDRLPRAGCPARHGPRVSKRSRQADRLLRGRTDLATTLAQYPRATRATVAVSPLLRSRTPLRSSIADRRASGFLQVSLSKVPRHQHRGAPARLDPRHFR